MLEFKCDPKVADFPLVGSGVEPVLVAPRTKGGKAMRWETGGDVDAFIAFAGAGDLVNVGGALYRKSPDGALHPESLLSGVVVVPPAGDWFIVDGVSLTQTFARVVGFPAGGGEVVVSASSVVGDSADRKDVGGVIPVPTSPATSSAEGEAANREVAGGSNQSQSDSPSASSSGVEDSAASAPVVTKKAAPRKAAAPKAKAKEKEKADG